MHPVRFRPSNQSIFSSDQAAMSDRAPRVIENVKSSRYSVARLYGKVTAYGHTYIYERSRDRLVRLDVYKAKGETP